MVARWSRIIITRLLWGLAGIRIGAISVDATKSHSKQDNGDVFDGQSYQIAYNKFVSQTSTRFGLAARRYSSRDYRTFNDHVWANNKDNYRRDENDVYDIADYYQNDFGRKIASLPI